MNNSGIFSNDCGPLSNLDFDMPKSYKHGVENHDTSVFVVKEGKIVYANAEERFSLVKHDGRSPINVIVDIKKHFDNELINKLAGWQRKVNGFVISHHISHIYEVFYNSGFDEAAVFINDGCGTENDCITLAYMKRGEKPIILKKFKMEYSLGWLYSIFSNCIFMKFNTSISWQEGKLMGLASYGKPIPGLTLVDIVDGELVWNIKVLKELGIIFTQNEELKNVKRCLINEYPILVQANYAATLQRDFENCSIKAVQLLHSLLKKNGIETKNLCMSGGCILNCPTNSKIIDLGLFEHYYASPNPTDGGVGLGFLYYKLIEEDKQNAFQYKRLESPYLGHNYSYEEILKDLNYLKEAGEYRKWIINLEEPPYNLLCSYLADQKILCWYQGGAEFGPRALGHRSLLADPRTFNMNQKLNHIKGREPWRPLAPVVPEELFKDVFEVENTDLCEFMLRTLKIKDKWVPMLRGVCHVDGTARPQLLKKSLNPELYNLLMVWYKKTGCPALINTSLNAAGLPIIERSGQVLEFMHEANTSDLVGVFVGSSAEMTIVPNVVE